MPLTLSMGAVLFFVGSLSFMVVLFANGGWQRSRQFTVIGRLCAGKLGSGRRWLTLSSLSLTAVGATLCFASVVTMDAERAERCVAHCTRQGFETGRIGPSQDRSPQQRFVACTCVSVDRPALELRADSVR